MTPVHFVTSVDLPDSTLVRGANKSDAHRKCVSHALNHNLDPLPPPKEKTISLSLHLSPVLLAKLEVKAKEYGMSVSGMFAALANAGMLHIEGAEKKRDEAISEVQNEDWLKDQLLLSKKEARRPEQDKFWSNLAAGLHLNQVVMAEASTGVGKGRAIVSAAVMSAKEGKVPVIIAAPTIKILSQLWDEMSSKAGLKAVKGLKVAFLPGRQEFVDSDRLREYIAERRCDDKAVEAWVDKDAPNMHGGHLAEIAHMAGIKLRWLMSDLREIATDLRPDDFALDDTSDPQADGYQQLQALRDYAATADIVFCTQTMLALMHKFGWRQLPRVIEKGDDDKRVNKPVILIDEAHVFEESVAKVESNDLSLLMMRFYFADALKKLGATGKGSSALKDAISAVNGLMAECKAFWTKDASKIVVASGRKSWNQDATHHEVGRKALPHIQKLLALMGKRGAMSTVFRRDEMVATLQAIEKVLTRKSEYNRLVLDFSPARKFPSFTVGAADVSGILSDLWNVASGGAGLVSATFWQLDSDGRERADYMRKVLNVPMGDKTYIPAPVVWSEIYAAPQRFLPHPDVAPDLVPPDNITDEEGFSRWCEAQAKLMKQFNDNMVAKDGGTLALCTSYAQIEQLKNFLVAEGVAEERLVENSGRMAADKEKFVQKHRAGLKPIWLALGPAWTGLDLRDEEKDPEDDTLLSDLIITRIPLGLNRSVTMDARAARNIHAVIQEGMLKFKQGLGRIIRASGLKNRRILVLDGRLMVASKNQFMKSAMGSAKEMLGMYHKKGMFPPIKR